MQHLDDKIGPLVDDFIEDPTTRLRNVQELHQLMMKRSTKKCPV